MKISVIIPVYNGEKWVAQCIENVLCQSYKDLEVIVVDDGSTDATAEIASRYPVKLIRQANKGLSGARNTGIDAATGNYIHFMDVDDWINLHYYERMAEAAALTEADMAFGETIHEGSNRLTHRFSESWLVSDPEDKFALTNVGRNGCAWRYIIRKSFLTNSGLRFEEGRLCEDIPFSVLAVCKAQKIVTVPGAVYYYKRRMGSIMQNRDPKGILKRQEDTEWAKATRLAIMRQYGLPNIYLHPRPVQVFQYKLLGIPMAEKKILNNGKVRLYLFGLRVMQKK